MIDEDIDSFNELLYRQVFAALLIVIKEAISNKEMNLGNKPTAVRVSPLFLLRDDTAIFINSLTVLFIKHVKIPQSSLSPSYTIQNLVNLCLRLGISHLFKL